MQFSILSLLFFFTLSLADVFVYRGIKVENYQYTQPSMSDNKRSVIQYGIDTRVSTQTRSDKGFYMHKRQANVVVDLLGVEHLLSLTLNEQLLHEDYHVIHGGPDGVKNITYGAENCYYYGNVEGVEDSFLAVSTCGQKLEGFISVEGQFFSIVPRDVSDNRERSSEGDHVVFKDDDILDAIPYSCGSDHDQGEEEDEIEFKKWELGNDQEELEYANSQLNKRGNRYVEFLAVNDFARVTALTAAQVQQDTINIVNAINQLYVQQAFPAIDGLIVFNLKGQYVPTSEQWQVGVSQPDSNTLLNEFTTWRRSKLGLTSDALGSNDNAHLFSGRDFISGTNTGVAGVAWIGTMCGSSSNGISEAWSSRSLGTTALIIAHELGHNFGSQHDSYGNSCPNSGYIMSGTACSTCKTWSSCSVDYINTKLPNYSCLNNAPSSNKCGDFVVNSGEQCDFGPDGSACCNGASSASPCTWKTGAVCDNSSPCCSNCQPRPTSFVCRSAPSTNPCDADDYCGVDGMCTDLKKPDGATCGTNQVCSAGTCVSRESQCSLLNNYYFSAASGLIKGPFVPCNVDSCVVSCTGNPSDYCVAMNVYGFPSTLMNYVSKGLSCKCSDGKSGVCPGSSGTCDCTSVVVKTTTTTAVKTTTTVTQNATPTSTAIKATTTAMPTATVTKTKYVTRTATATVTPTCSGTVTP